MNITLWGVRGSITTTSPETKEYGGNTSCVEVDADGWLLLLDGGSGIQGMNCARKVNNSRVDILLTHLLFNPAAEVHIWGPAGSSQTLRARLGRYFSPPLFPVYFRNLTCKLILHEIAKTSFTIGPFTIQSDYVIHPGPTVGFRIQHQRGIFTYIPDHEFALGCNVYKVKDLRWLSGSELASGADLLVHDAQYTSEEYQAKQGWGHSSMEDTIQFARLNQVKQLLLSHHDPMHSDEQLRFILNQLKEKRKGSVAFDMAVEGSTIEL
jgi:ribonuclease BN (tRNA processing enzyme)